MPHRLLLYLYFILNRAYFVLSLNGRYFVQYQQVVHVVYVVMREKTMVICFME